MAKYLEIKRLSNPNYISLKKETDNFTLPVIFELPKYNDDSVQKLKTELIAFENGDKSKIFSDNDDLMSLNEATSKSVTKDYQQPFFIFLTKDKVVSPVEFKSKKYLEIVEQMTKFFFETDFLNSKLEDCSILHKLGLFIFLKKDLFGSLSNLSNFVNINSAYSHGNTNTFIHADSGLSGFFMQMEGSKKWWIASPIQEKNAIKTIFQCDSTKLNLNTPLFDDFEYYDFELRQGDIFYLPANWLHGVVAPQGSNLTLLCRFPINLREILTNIMHWQSIGVPLNHLKQSPIDENKTMADMGSEQAEMFQKLTFYLREHSFSSRKVKDEEVASVSGFYDYKKLGEIISGGE